MYSIKYLSRSLCLTFTWVFFLSLVTNAGITAPDSFKGTDLKCPHTTPGSTTLGYFTFVTAADLAAGLGYDNLMDLNMAGQFKGIWDYQLNSGLNGKLAVSKYLALDGPGSCQHGAEIEATMTITGGLAAGQQFQWIQIYHESGNSGNGSFIGDPPKNSKIPILDENGNKVGEKVMDDLPFYYNAGDNRLTFWDRPTDPIDDAKVPHSGGVSFMTLLTSWNGIYDAIDANVVNIYGGFQWGYTYECHKLVVPVPGSLGLTLIALFVLNRKNH